jgi:putative ABC transport system permease protein
MNRIFFKLKLIFVKSIKKSSFNICSYLIIDKIVRQDLHRRFFLHALKIIGLSLSLSGCLIIGLFIKFELSYEDFNKNKDQCYRLTIDYLASANERHFACVYNATYLQKMQEYFPQIRNYSRLSLIRDKIILNGEESLPLNEGFYCDSTFFSVFDVEVVEGNRQPSLTKPNSVVISETLSKKLYGSTDPIGKILTLAEEKNIRSSVIYIVNGVIKDFPKNCHFHPEILINSVDKSVFSRWSWVYLLLTKGSDPRIITNRFNDFFALYIRANAKEIKMQAYLDNIKDIHLLSNKEKEIEKNSDYNVIYSLSIATLILVITGFLNYFNLNIGMAGRKSKFLFISRILGEKLPSIKYSLIDGLYFLFFLVIFSLPIYVIMEFAFQKNYNINLHECNLLTIFAAIIIFCAFVIIIDALTIYLYDIKPTRLNNVIQTTGKRTSISIILIQFTISIVLMTSSFVIYRQSKFALISSIGFNKHMLCIKKIPTEIQRKFELFKNEMLKDGDVEFVSGMYVDPGEQPKDILEFKMAGYIPDPENRADRYIGILPCDYSFASMFGLEFLAGRNFTSTLSDHSGSGEYIINEAAMKRLNYTDPNEIVGKDFQIISSENNILIPSGQIIGVVKDFYLSSIKKKEEPVVLFKNESLYLSNFVISFKSRITDKQLVNLKNNWTLLFPDNTFHYEYVNLIYKQLYQPEIFQYSLLLIFTIISLFICTMGLLGMTLLSIRNRIKEISLRKIVGASVQNLYLMLSWDILKWVILANIIAIPISIFSLNKWLQSFSIKIELSWWIFFNSFIISIIIVLLTVSFHIFKATKINPSEILKYEK